MNSLPSALARLLLKFGLASALLLAAPVAANAQTGNTATGEGALFSNTNGNANTASGYYALTANTTGFGNSAFGQNALHSNTVGLRNVAVGNGAGYYVTTGSNNIHIANYGYSSDLSAHRAAQIAGRRS